MLGKYLKHQFWKRLAFCYFVTVNLLKTEECEIRHIFNNPFGQRRKDFARLSWQGELHRHIIDRHSQSVWFASLSSIAWTAAGIIRIFRGIGVTNSHKKELGHCRVKLVASLKKALVQEPNVCAMFGLVQFLQLGFQPFEVLSVPIGRGKMSPSRLCLFKLINQLQELAGIFGISSWIWKNLSNFADLPNNSKSFLISANSRKNA